MKNEGGRRRRRVTYTERRLERPRARTNPMVWFSAPAKPFPITTARRIAPSNISGIASFQFEKKKEERRSCRSISIAWHLFSFFFFFHLYRDHGPSPLFQVKARTRPAQRKTVFILFCRAESQTDSAVASEQNVGKRRRWCSGGDSRNFHGFLHRWGIFFLPFFFQYSTRWKLYQHLGVLILFYF